MFVAGKSEGARSVAIGEVTRDKVPFRKQNAITRWSGLQFDPPHSLIVIDSIARLINCAANNAHDFLSYWIACSTDEGKSRDVARQTHTTCHDDIGIWPDLRHCSGEGLAHGDGESNAFSSSRNFAARSYCSAATAASRSRIIFTRKFCTRSISAPPTGLLPK